MKLDNNVLKKLRLFIDMDGVVAKWEQNQYEKTWEPGYFYTLNPEPVMVEVVKKLKELGVTECMLSAAYMNGIAEVDKDKWLNKVGLKEINRKFVPCGQNKADFIDIEKDCIYVLLDDYTPNLTKWERTSGKNGSKFIGIKFLNGINGSTRTWDGYSVWVNTSAQKIVDSILAFATMEDV